MEMQRIVTADAMRAALEVKDYAGASRRRSELEVVGVPTEMKPAIAVLRGRLAEALGHDKDALDAYRYAAIPPRPAAAAEAKLLEIMLRQKRERDRPGRSAARAGDAVAVWRGDAIEVKTLQMMAQHLCRHRPLQRVAGGGADRDAAAAEFRSLAAGPGHGVGAVRAALPQPEGRRPAADRRARRCSTSFAS